MSRTGPVDILLFSVELGRYGPPRLPECLARAGLRVAALCDAGDLLAASCHLQSCTVLPISRTLGGLGGALCRTIATLRPRLVIPGDEQAVMIMQTLTRPRGARIARRAGTDVASILAASLGEPRYYDASLLKTQTLAVARRIGVPTPCSHTVTSADAAVIAAARMGYPVYCKASFGWAGRGVTRCEDGLALRKAFDATQHRFGNLRAIMRRLADRDWYPVDTPIDVQSGVSGGSAMVCALAWQGRMVAATSAERLVTSSANGPSVAVRLRHDPGMVKNAGRMIAALGLHGFASFDFMVPSDGSEALLLECNPRPVPIVHHAVRVGVDFPEVLAGLMRGRCAPVTPVLAQGHADVLLFPGSLDPAWADEAKRRGWHVDIPFGEPGLIAAVQSRPEAERALPPPTVASIAA